MNYAIKTLMNQAELIKDLLEKKEDEFENAELEMQAEYNMFVDDIGNLKHQLKQLVDAIEVLRLKY